MTHALPQSERNAVRTEEEETTEHQHTQVMYCNCIQVKSDFTVKEKSLLPV